MKRFCRVVGGAALSIAVSVVVVPLAAAQTLSSAATKARGTTPSNPVFVPIPQPSTMPPGAVDIAAISNGCGGGKYKILIAAQNAFGDSSTYRNSLNPFGQRFTVNFRPACDLHDAGYSGAYVWDNINGKWVDYFPMSKQLVDAKFLFDMRKLCEDQIQDAPVALAACKATGEHILGGHISSNGAESRYNFVVDYGEGYRARPDLNGMWANVADHVSPPWIVTQKGRVVTATWHGNKADGHPDLQGHFQGTLTSYDPTQTVPPPRDDVVEGTMRVVEGSLAPTGAMTFTLSGTNPDQFSLTYQQSNGSEAAPITMERVK